MIKFGLFSVNADLFLTSLAQKVRIQTFSANADHGGSTAYSRFLEFEINNVSWEKIFTLIMPPFTSHYERQIVLVPYLVPEPVLVIDILHDVLWLVRNGE